MAPVNKSKAKAAKQKSEAAKKTQDEETIDEDVQGVLVVDNKATKGQKVTKVKVDPKSQPVFSLLCKYLFPFSPFSLAPRSFAHTHAHTHTHTPKPL